MSKEIVKKLLEKYYSGNSTEDEEKLLRCLLSDEKISGEFSDEREIFKFFCSRDLNIPQPSDNFEESIKSAIEIQYRAHEGNNLRKLRYYISGIAAAIVTLTGFYFFFLREKEPKDTFADPAVAYSETMKALYQVSSRLNTGIVAVEPLGKLHIITQNSLNSIIEPASLVEDKLKDLVQLEKAVEILTKDNDQETNH